MEEDKVGEAVVLVEEAGLVAEVGPQAVVPNTGDDLLYRVSQQVSDLGWVD